MFFQPYQMFTVFSMDQSAVLKYFFLIQRNSKPDNQTEVPIVSIHHI